MLQGRTPGASPFVNSTPPASRAAPRAPAVTRRTALAASVTLPLLPVSAFATPSNGAVAADPPTVTADAEIIGLGAELDTAWARERALGDSDDSGEAFEVAWFATAAVVAKIEQHQAHTLEGLRVKARAVMWCHQGDEMDGEQFSLSEQQTTDIRLVESIVLDLVGVAS